MVAVHAPEMGPVALFGSGETGKHGRQVQETLLGRYAPPVRVAIVETPVGFQPNVDVITGKLRAFYEHNLQNARPIVSVVPARRRGGPNDPDEPSVVAGLTGADLIFAGPGSPTYAVRHLADTRTLAAIRERWRAGATLALASAAAIAAGRLALPVYEIYKVGDNPVWTSGLDLLGDLGLSLAVVPHWNNREGGADLDTSRSYIGRARFGLLLDLLPPNVAVLGIDEHTAVVLDPALQTAAVRGAGTATLLTAGTTTTCAAGEQLPLGALRGGTRIAP